MNYWQKTLVTHFDQRKLRSRAYSLRGFALFLDVSPAQLSQLLSGKRSLTPRMANQIIEKLELSPYEKDEFLLSALSAEPGPKELATQLADDEFALISDWYHFAILSLCDLKGAKGDSLWISRRLGLSHGKTKEALERLERLGIIERKDGRIKQVKKNLKTTTDVPSSAIRKYHKQNLALAVEKLETVPVDEREFTAITMPTNPAKLKEAKKIINEFKRKLGDLLDDPDASEVYTFSVQLFPVSTKDKK